jgi:hypothetical protein
MKRALMVLLCLIAVLGVAQDDGYEMAKVVSFERVANSEQHPENADQYKISFRLGEMIYLCRASGPASTFVDWTINKQYPAKVAEKKLLVKNTDGQILEMTITGKKRPK